MADSNNGPHQNSTWYRRIVNPERLEAPDRNFVGHRDILTRNLARYHFTAPQLHGTVLEVGCGRGYGLEIVRPKVKLAVGADISWPFLADSMQVAPLVQANGVNLPFVDHQFDAVIAFEVIEHIHSDQTFIEELIRVVQREALITISTPNRLVASGQAGRPLDPYHVREYTAAEFNEILRRAFSSVVMYGQHDRTSTAAPTNRLIDRIPIRWKYMLPATMQGWMSVRLRQPLKLADCHFDTKDLDNAHTLLAICHI